MSAYRKLKIIEAQSAREQAEEYARAKEQLGVEQNNVHAIRDRIEGSNYLVRNHFWGANIVCETGNVFYAQKIASEALTQDFATTTNRLILRTAADTPLTGDNYGAVATPLTTSHKIRSSGYPRTNDPDSLNNVTNKNRKITWKYAYTTSEAAHATIYGGAVHNGGDSPSTTTALLCHFTFSGTVPFEKTTNDTLVVYVNHEMLGQ